VEGRLAAGTLDYFPINGGKIVNIAMNATNIFRSAEVCGVGQYAISLLTGFDQIGRLGHFRIIGNPEVGKVFERHFPKLYSKTAPYPPLLDRFRWKDGFFRQLYIERRSVPSFNRQEKADILFHPFMAQNLSVSKSSRTVVTAHDLFLRRFPDQLSKKYFHMLDRSYRKTLLGATRIVTPSQFVKKDILDFYPEVPNEKITVIPNPIVVNAEEKTPFPVPSPYLLSVNAIRYHKNLITLIKAFERIHRQIEHSLVLTGPAIPSISNGIARYIEEKKIPKVFFTGYVSDAQRNYLYQNAALFVSPSLCEGFGITPIEAALFGIPVITTRETSIPEVTQNLLHYYEPATDEIRLAEKILEVIQEHPNPDRMLSIQATFRKAYSPSTIAQLYWECFRQTLEVDRFGESPL